jgi:biotin operon repressor
MRSARLAHSPRLQRVLALLADGLPHSTRQIIQEAHICAVNSAVSELRDNGIPIRCSKALGIYYYQIDAKKKEVSPC